MSELKGLANILGDVCLDGTIEELVLIVKDKVGYIKAMDITNTLFVDTQTPIEMDDCSIGIGDVKFLEKLTSSASNVSLIGETHLRIRPERALKVDYKLYDIDLIPTYDPDWGDNLVKDELSSGSYSEPFKLNEERITQFKKYTDIFKPSSIDILVENGVVILQCKDSRALHELEVKLGKIEGIDTLSIKVLGSFITPVFNRLEFDNDPVMYLSQDGAVIVQSDTTTWMVQPIEQSNQ